MYSYDWDAETGGYVLNSTLLKFSKEPRPVYYKELDILGFDKYWNYAKDDTYPYMWAESNSYWYRGRKVAQTKGGALYTAPELILLEDPEPDGKPLKFVDIPRMVEKNHTIMESLVQETIKKVYNTYVEYKDRVDVFYVAFSGGKDSVVALDIVQRALPHNEFKVLFGDTGMEFPDTYELVDKIKVICHENGIDFRTAKSELNPIETWNTFGPPSQTIRWCCSVHKTTPQVLFLRKYLKNPQFRGMAFTGIRGDESASRSEYSDVSMGEKIRGQYSCHPILDWNSAELFNYIFENKLMFNNAYKSGNSRAGCLVCPLATNKNMFFKEQVYSTNTGHRTTTEFNDIIIKTTSKALTSSEAVEEFMNIAGWKARRSGRELSFAQSFVEENFEKGKLTITLYHNSSNWKEWIKTIGNPVFLENGDVIVSFEGNPYHIYVSCKDGINTFVLELSSYTKKDILFMSALKVVFRKSAYCIKCRVCEANCPHGYISMDNNEVIIDDKCIKCKKCHDIAYGCLVANSVRLPKGERKMGSISQYDNMGFERAWIEEYFKKKDEFWESGHSLGTNKIKHLKSFLRNSGITEKNKFSKFGKVIDRLGIDTVEAWALIMCNLAYSAQFDWWIKNIDWDVPYTPDMLKSMLDDDYSENVKKNVVSAFKNIFISNKLLGEEIQMGVCDYTEKNNQRKLTTVTRGHWEFPEPLVILYSLYKFAEACDGYYEFTLRRLLDHEVESDGVSPTQIFGLDEEQMKKILNGLSVNYPEFINASFTLDLDNITLRSDKTSADVLELF